MDKIYDRIYNDVFSNILRANIDLFLCGGASNKNYTSYRDQLRNKLISERRLSILYPENLFMEILNRKNYDLLTLENFLADNSDYILIVCESPGSFTELGAFVNNKSTLNKTVVLLQNKFKNDKSFINQGPIQHIKNINPNNVVYYNSSDICSVANKIIKLLGVNKKHFKYKPGDFKDLNLITGQYYFVLLALFFFKSIEVKVLSSQLKRLYIINSYPKEQFDLIYSAAVKRLFKDGMITKQGLKESSKYELTSKGYYFSKGLLSYVNKKSKTRIFNKIRMDIIRYGLIS